MAITSPFPGMDPWLEQQWGDVHARLVTYASDQLRGKLPKGLRARMQERVFVEPVFGDGRAVYPDVRVVEHGRGGVALAAPTGAAVGEPVVIHLDDEPVTQSYIEI